MTVAENIHLGREPLTRPASSIARRCASDRRARSPNSPRRSAPASTPTIWWPSCPADQRPDRRNSQGAANLRSRIVIFDEATAALDRNQVAVLFRHVRALQAPRAAPSSSFRTASTRCFDDRRPGDGDAQRPHRADVSRAESDPRPDRRCHGRWCTADAHRSHGTARPPRESCSQVDGPRSRAS